MGINDTVLTKNEWPEKESAFKSPWVVGWIVMVAVIFTANMVMITFAYRTSPGLVVEDYYEKGKNYNSSLEKIAAQKALGWHADLSIPETVSAGEAAAYGLTVVDAEGMAVVADKVEIYAFRPSDVSADFKTEMRHKDSGLYAGEITFPLPGVWDMVVNIVRGEDQFEVTDRVFVGKKEGS